MAIIDKPSDYFNSNLHTGNGGTQNITSLDFQADQHSHGSFAEQLMIL